MKVKTMVIAVLALGAMLLSTGCALYSNVRKVEDNQETRVVSVIGLPVYVSSHPEYPVRVR